MSFVVKAVCGKLV
ncbi:hypothetical protein M2G60_22610 [Vibrio vulnificus]|nr:hypothetical protein [Vibrio vulnificus]